MRARAKAPTQEAAAASAKWKGRWTEQSQTGASMNKDRDQHEIWDPFCELDGGLSKKQRAEIERGQAWAYYINGGGGDPRYFDYETYIRGAGRTRET
jgi:hypothetical protein